MLSPEPSREERAPRHRVEPATHPKYVNIDWMPAPPYSGQQPEMTSWDVVPCACTTPWHHYP